jgi:hypothetical protein
MSIDEEVNKEKIDVDEKGKVEEDDNEIFYLS